MGGVERWCARQVVAKAAVQDGADRDAGVQCDAVLHGLNYENNSVLRKPVQSFNNYYLNWFYARDLTVAFMCACKLVKHLM